MRRRVWVNLVVGFIVIGGTYLLSPPSSRRPQQLPSAQSVDWEEFRCTEGSFNLLMPGTPTPSKEYRLQFLGLKIFLWKSFSLERREFPARFSVVYEDLPFLNQIQTDELFDDIGKAIQSQKKGKLEVKPIRLERHLGREFVLDHQSRDNWVEIARVYLVKNRLYHVEVTTPPGAGFG